MNPLRHFLYKDRWSKQYSFGKCEKCGEKLPGEMLFPTEDVTITTTNPNVRVGPSVRRQNIRSATTSRRAKLCSTCYRDQPSQRLIRGEPPEYVSKRLSFREKREIMGTDNP